MNTKSILLNMDDKLKGELDNAYKEYVGRPDNKIVSMSEFVRQLLNYGIVNKVLL